MATLGEILAAREARYRRQRAWLTRYRAPLLSCSLRIPGPDKQSPRYRRAFEAILAAVEKDLPEGTILAKVVLHPETGSEALYAVAMAPEMLKRRMMAMEEGHPLGALCDLDVVDRTGQPLGREMLGAAPRRCFCCGRPARLCTREKRHPLPEVRAAIDGILDRWEGIG